MMMTKAELAAWLQSHDNYAIISHRRPDGDTLGSAATLCRLLRTLGKTAHVLENPEITPRYAHLFAGLTKVQPEEGDTLVCTDVASPSMLPDRCKALQDKILLRIDHHGSATSFTPFELAEPHAASCGEILYDLAQIWGISMDRPTAEALYTAVSTDTGCFRYANTTAHSFLTAAACADAGANIFAINQALFDTNSLAKLRIHGWMAENTRFFRDGTLAVCAIPRSVELELGVTEDDMDNISGFPRSIEGVCMAATLREQPDGLVKISVRAVPGYDAAAVCERFGGGGHKGAAGANTSLSLEDAATKIAQVMLEA